MQIFKKTVEHLTLSTYEAGDTPATRTTLFDVHDNQVQIIQYDDGSTPLVSVSSAGQLYSTIRHVSADEVAAFLESYDHAA